MTSGDSCDVLVLSVIGPELGALQKALGCSDTPPHELEDHTLIWRASIDSQVGGCTYSVALAAVGSPGPEDAAAATAGLLARLKPGFAILAGIAAGLRNKNKIGNVLVAESVFAYERGALEEKGFVARPRTLELETAVRQRLTAYWAQGERPSPSQSNQAFIRPTPLPGQEGEFALHVADKLNFKPATIASGSKLLRDGKFLNAVRENGHGQIEAGEMEGAGFCLACRNNGTRWLVVRGISDFGDSLKNDDFHRFAAIAAAACAIDMLKNVVTIDTSRTRARGEARSTQTHHASLLAHLEQARVSGDSSKNRFNLTVSIASDYESLQRSNFLYKSKSAREVISQRELIKRLLIHSPGGAGKSTILRDLAIESIRSGLATFFIDLKDGFSPLDANKGFLEQAFERSLAGSYTQFLAACGAGLPTLIFIDGLNESAINASEQLLRETVALVAKYESLHFVATDRMNTQRAASNCLRGGVDPLSQGEIERHLPSGKRVTRDADWNLLSMPFFLDLQLLLWSKPSKGSENEVLSRQNMFFEYLYRVCEITEEQIRILASAAHLGYRQFARRTIESSWWKTKAGPELAEILDRVGATQSKRLGGTQVTAFRHQLIHDFLVAYNIARGEKDWSGRSFDAATFEASSIEPLSFAAELLGVGKSDEFIMAVYDWNYPAAIETVVDLDASATPSPVTRDLKFALTAVNAEKTLDVFSETAGGARRRLERSGWADARKFAEVRDMNQLLEVVSAFSPTLPLYKNWKNLFLLSPPSVATEKEVALIWGEPLSGWTAANVLRRLELSDDALAQLRILYRIAYAEARFTVCWRVVHVLGRFPSQETVGLLKEALRSEGYQWIRYGALRSLIEVAFRDAAQRSAILHWLVAQLDLIGAATSVLREVRRTALVGEADAEWYTQFLPVLESAAQHPGAEQEKEQWEQVINEVKKRKASA